MDNTTKVLLLKAVTRMPDWVRHDLASKDNAIRLRAEETLTLMLIAAIENEVPVAE